MVLIESLYTQNYPMKKILIVIALLFLFPLGTLAQGQPSTDSYEIQATVFEILSEEGQEHLFIAKDSTGRSYRVDGSEGYTAERGYDLVVNKKVLLQIVTNNDGTETAFLIDVVRFPNLIWIFLLFAAVAIIVGYMRGLMALVGLAFTIIVLFAFVFPQILAGSNPVNTIVIASLFILAVNMHLTHGFSKQIFSAFMSTVVGLGLVVFFAKLFTVIANLSGLASEEATLLYLESGQTIDPTGLLLAGIILGAVGVLDDITITQTETVAELHKTDESLGSKKLFKKAMRVGRHHIASVVNTLVLAYAGVALPLFLIFLATQDMDWWRLLNEEPVAEEIVRTLAGTIALVLLVPISTWFAVMTVKRFKK